MKMITIEMDSSMRLKDIVNAIGGELRKKHPELQDNIVISGNKPTAEETCVEYVKLVIEDNSIGYVYDIVTRAPMLK